MTAVWVQVILSVLVVSLISLVGIVTISISERRLKAALFFMIALAAGGMFGDVFIHLLPESYRESKSGTSTAIYVLAGLFGFFILEKLLRWRHEHALTERDQIQPLGWLSLISDGLHNLFDGMLIGASYLVSSEVGLTTTIAVLLHEIPQEIGDFGILIQSGMSRARALLFNYASATLCIAGAIISLLIGPNLEGFTTVMVPITAGGFIYIAGSDLLPELHRESDPGRSILQLLAMAVGVGLMLVLTALE